MNSSSQIALVTGVNHANAFFDDIMYLFNKLGCGVLWTGYARPQHPTPQFIE